MTDKPIGERVSHLEGVLEQALPALTRMEEKLDKALNGLQDKAGKASVASAHEEIDKLQLAMEKKADKTDVDVVRAEVKLVREKVLLWTGGGAVILVLAGWYGPKLLAMLAK